MQSTSAHTFNTRAVHAGHSTDPTTGAMISPICQSTTFAQVGIGEDLGRPVELGRVSRGDHPDCVAAIRGRADNGERDLLLAWPQTAPYGEGPPADETGQAFLCRAQRRIEVDVVVEFGVSQDQRSFRVGVVAEIVTALRAEGGVALEGVQASRAFIHGRSDRQ